ncbi:putative RNA binding protein Rnp24 [Aspergillus clavatus NRRL 1]|uniref:RNA binding protein Rnp24, putative n=1 Tax=Aspergillus clavatus (strain ATCC 1007 / CBS 513.65 / DSM 816 / NCTC 3887 / NRRL 1 / QM 1276 / 107) TaxID=344612 RepID=A1CJ54_ASPCL|nr:RNA binding protein Rnp24, putative [Aspergillus clavatus NRRL 1]EAW09178.1 RNA binding protein Rnp24, putative [Aspergillus clavatus NRRL 1]
MADLTEKSHKKRKLTDVPEIEIDVSAPEPPSKKALRKAKKKSGDSTTETATQESTTVPAKEAKEQDASKKRSEYGIWIGNLPFTVTKDDLRKFITSNCTFADTTITRIHMPKGPEKFGKPQNKGFAYIDLATEKAVQEALGASEQLLSGRRVLIKDAKNFSGRPEKSKEEGQNDSAAASGKPPSKRIFVGNLDFDATRELLEENFSQCGPVAMVHVATFQDTGKCKGYAWVTFEDLASAEAAVKGFVMVGEDDEDDEDIEEEDSKKSKKSKKPRKRRVWVNQLLGRRMRMEFAEDPTTRYKKRYGKDGEGKKRTTSDITEVEDGTFDQGASEEKPQRPRFEKPKRSKPDYTRYDQDTVQKLSGAIVESQGKKTTFD